MARRRLPPIGTRRRTAATSVGARTRRPAAHKQPLRSPWVSRCYHSSRYADPSHRKPRTQHPMRPRPGRREADQELSAHPRTRSQRDQFLNALDRPFTRRWSRLALSGSCALAVGERCDRECWSCDPPASVSAATARTPECPAGSVGCRSLRCFDEDSALLVRTLVVDLTKHRPDAIVVLVAAGPRDAGGLRHRGTPGAVRPRYPPRRDDSSPQWRDIDHPRAREITGGDNTVCTSNKSGGVCTMISPAQR